MNYTSLIVLFTGIVPTTSLSQPTINNAMPQPSVSSLPIQQPVTSVAAGQQGGTAPVAQQAVTAGQPFAATPGSLPIQVAGSIAPQAVNQATAAAAPVPIVQQTAAVNQMMSVQVPVSTPGGIVMQTVQVPVQQQQQQNQIQQVRSLNRINLKYKEN